MSGKQWCGFFYRTELDPEQYRYPDLHPQKEKVEKELGILCGRLAPESLNDLWTTRLSCGRMI
jgi:hypothetical protein